MHGTKQRLLEAAMTRLLEHGYHDLSVQSLLDQTSIPKGSFYHHFENKEDMALQAVELYTGIGREQLAALARTDRPPLERVREFFLWLRGMYASQGYLGCLLGALGQELSGVNDRFRGKIEQCLAAIAAPIADCLEEARRCGDLPEDTDARRLADALVNAWEGAALRSRLLRSPAPLDAFLDYELRILARS